jgi:23S rRNA (uracil1939-C5)-methyltransferase
LTVFLKVTKSAFGGEGIALFEGKTCFVQGALPGETVEAQIVQEKKNFAKARTLRVLEASAQRVEPPCPHYGTCGGCQYQHVSYQEERRLKVLQLSETMERLAGVKAPIEPMLYSEKEYHYRNSVTFHVAWNPKPLPPVFYFIGNDNVSQVTIRRCDILDDRFEPILKTPVSLQKKIKKINFKLSQSGDIVSDEEERFFRIRLNGEPIIANSKGFFQTNLRITELLVEKVKEWVNAAQPQVFFDLYAGVGTFSWLCAKEVLRIFCIEENPFSISALRMNREEKNAKSVEIIPGRVENVFPPLLARVGAKEAVLLMDPPRQGLEKSLAEKIAQLEGAKALIYISCDIPTLARDLKIILSGKRFVLSQVVPLDMFPRTKHIEAAVLLTV